VSIRIIKQGIFDTVQDEGRYGFQHLGINPGGAADNVSHAIANMLVGNALGEAVIELHYPAPVILFEQGAVIALAGADFGATINGKAVPLHTTIVIPANSTLQFTGLLKGYCCYIVVSGGWQVTPWLGSASTNVKAGAGGYNGRRLLTGDVIPFKQQQLLSTLAVGNSFIAGSWKVLPQMASAREHIIRVCPGNEFDLLTEASKNLFYQSAFRVMHELDRMGCRLSGIPLQTVDIINLVSIAVTRGTIQLLPTGQLIILCADHQTTGGYPRAAHVIAADMHIAAQLQPGDTVRFARVDINEAENLLLQQHEYLQRLQLTCNLRLQEFLLTHVIH